MATAAVISNLPSKVTLHIQQGDRFGPFPIRVRNPNGTYVDLTGSAFVGHIRRNALDADPPVAAFNFAPVDATTWHYWLDAAQTRDLVAGERLTDAESAYVFDMQWTDSGGTPRTFVGGPALVQREVTRA